MAESIVSHLDNFTTGCCDTAKWRRDNLSGMTSNIEYLFFLLLKSIDTTLYSFHQHNVVSIAKVQQAYF